MALSGLDHLFAITLNKVIKDKLGAKTVKKVESRLFEKYGISLTQGIEEFEKFDLVLREIFGKGADGIEKKLFEHIFQTKSNSSKEKWLTISDPHITSIILQSYGDLEKKDILESVSVTPKIIADILEECDLPRTSGYRKVNSLIDDGLLTLSGFITSDYRRINKYVRVFKNLKINIDNSQVTIDVQLSKVDKSQSSIIQIIKV
jgi:hypothetical protein